MKIRGNGWAPDGVEAGAPYHPRDEMRCFDRLPRELRDLLNEAPWKMSAMGALGHVRAHGVDTVLKDYREALGEEE